MPSLTPAKKRTFILSSLVLCISPIRTQSAVGGISPTLISSSPESRSLANSFLLIFSSPSRLYISSNNAITLGYICLYCDASAFSSLSSSRSASSFILCSISDAATNSYRASRSSPTLTVVPDAAVYALSSGSSILTVL